MSSLLLESMSRLNSFVYDIVCCCQLMSACAVGKRATSAAGEYLNIDVLLSSTSPTPSSGVLCTLEFQSRNVTLRPLCRGRKSCFLACSLFFFLLLWVSLETFSLGPISLRVISSGVFSLGAMTGLRNRWF